MPHAGNNDLAALGARLSDLCAAAARGDTAMTPFLTPREAREATRCLAARLRVGTALLVGGYPGAERVRAILLPDYLEGLADPRELSADPVVALAAAGFEEIAAAISGAVVPVRIKGSGYRVLSHRDYLGALLHLGLERDAIGDILPMSDDEAIVLTGVGMAAFLEDNLTHIASDVVRVTRMPTDTPLTYERRLDSIHDTVASPRLDCVVAALCNLSRDRAQTAVRGGLVELDYETVQSCDVEVEPPSTISVRGYGKFAVHEIGGETRKGRLRLSAGKYL